MTSIESALFVWAIVNFIVAVVALAKVAKLREDMATELREKVSRVYNDIDKRENRELRWDFEALLDHLKMQRRTSSIPRLEPKD